MNRDEFQWVSSTGRHAPRRAPVAALMSLLLPGLGQLYNGEVALALRLLLAFVLLAVPGPALVALHLPAGWMVPALVLGLLAALGLWGFAVVQAWRAARLRADWLLQPWQTGSLYLLVLLLGTGVGLPALTQHVRAHQVESFRIPSASMAPTLLPGDIVTTGTPLGTGFSRKPPVFLKPGDRLRLGISGAGTSLGEQDLRCVASKRR